MQREHIHTRTIDFDAVAGPDGAVSLDAKLCDLRRIRFMSSVGGRVMRPGVVHDVELKLGTDSDRVVQESEFNMYTVPFTDREQAAGMACRDIEPAFDVLKGIKADDSYVRQVNARIGGRKGCFHGLALAIGAGPVITQTADRATGSVGDRGPARLGRYILVDGYRYGDSGVTLVGRMQDAVSLAGPLETPAPMGDVTREVELEFSFEVTDFTYHSLGAAIRGPEKVEGDAHEIARELEGLVLGAGVFADARRRLGGSEAGRILLELLSMMIPITTQAALAQLSRVGAHMPPGAGGSMAQINSCHMWADDGPLLARVRAMHDAAAEEAPDRAAEAETPK
jgi:hypothetical protein